MSHEATTLVKGRAFGSTSRKAVALVLADYCDAALSCFVGQDRLAFEAEVGVRTVRRILASLEADGLIRRTRRCDREGHRTTDRIELVESAIRCLPVKLSPGPCLPANHDRLPATDALLPAIHVVPTGQGLAGEPSLEPSERTVRKNRLPAKPAGADRFDEFYDAYPLHKAKAAARRAWDKAIKSTDPDRVIAGAVAYRDDPRRDPKFTKHPATWLNAGCWDDEPSEPARPRGFTGIEAFLSRQEPS